MFPGEPDATVDLDVLGRGVEVGLRAVGLRQRGSGGKLVVHLCGTPQAVVRGRLGRLDLEQHVGALVFDGLERADGATELHPVLGVLDCHFQDELGAAYLLGCQADDGEVEDGAECGPASAVGSDERALGAAELDLGLLARLVHGGQSRPGDAGAGGVDRVEADTGCAASGDDEQVGGMAVDDEALGAGDLARGVGGCGDPCFVPPSVLLGEGEGGDRFTRSDTRQVGCLGGLVAGVEQRQTGELAGEEGGAQQRPAHFLEDHTEFDEREPLAAELLGDDQALEAHLFGHLLPDGLVVSGLGVHELTDRRLGGLVLHERSHEATELFLFLGEGKVHARQSRQRRAASQSSTCTHVYTSLSRLLSWAHALLPPHPCRGS